MIFNLQLSFTQNVVRVSIHSKTLRNAGVTLTRREFEQVVRKPRLFDYIDSVYIDRNNDKYIVVTDDVKIRYNNIAEHPVIAELITYRKDFEQRIKIWMDTKGVSYVARGEKVTLSKEVMQPTCIWLVPKIKVMLGLDTHIQPPELIGHMHSCPIVDRTNTVHFGTPQLESDHPMPDFSKKFTLGLGDLMLYRAEELWQWIENDGRLGIIWWSGGIDSTALLVAMLRTATPERIKLIKIGMNQRSVEEYPSFFDNYVKHLPCVYVSHNDGTEIDLNALHITGEIGDQLFGSDYLRACFGGGGKDFPGKKHFVDNINAPWQDTISLFVRDQLKARDLPSEYVQPLMDTYEKLNTASPIEIRTLFDFWWWSNFNLKYTHVSNRLQLNSQQPHIAKDCVKAFFDTPNFQKWSVNNHDKKIGTTWKSYKGELKQFVFNFNKDKVWFTHKTKVQSLRMGVTAQFVIMDSNYQLYGMADRKQIIKTYFGGK